MTDPLAKLFGSAARLKLLRLFLFNPSESFTAPQAAARARISPAEARKELGVMLRARLLKRTRRARAQRYSIRGDFKYLPALQAFLLSASVDGEEVTKQLRRAGGIKFIALAGVFVGDWESTIDLLIAGDRVSERRLKGCIERLEAELGRELRYALLPTTEFSYRIAMSDKLVRDVLDYNHQVIFDRLNTGLQ